MLPRQTTFRNRFLHSSPRLDHMRDGNGCATSRTSNACRNIFLGPIDDREKADICCCHCTLWSHENPLSAIEFHIVFPLEIPCAEYQSSHLGVIDRMRGHFHPVKASLPLKSEIFKNVKKWNFENFENLKLFSEIFGMFLTFAQLSNAMHASPTSQNAIPILWTPRDHHVVSQFSPSHYVSNSNI